LAPGNGTGNGLGLSPFHIAALAFQRARQLKNGARPRVDAAGHRPTRLALLEVLADTISWSVEEKPSS
jgi:DNA-directed RNA polymerase subunit K/omega